MATIRKLTKPINRKELELNNIKYGQTGVIGNAIDKDIIDKTTEYKVKDLIPFIFHKYIDLDKN